MSTNYGFEPTLDGLNNIDANSSTTTNIICDTIQINTSGIAPTMPPLDNSTKIATTSYVDTAISAVGGVSLSGTNVFTGFNSFNTNLPTSTISATSGNELVNKTTLDAAITTASGSYVTLAGTQTITGEKTFNNANTNITNLNTEFIYNTEDITSKNVRVDEIFRLTDTLFSQGATEFLIQNSLTGGNYKFKTYDTSGFGRTALDLLTDSATFYNNVISPNITSNNISSVLATDNISIVPSQSTGVCNIATFSTRSGAINLGTGASSTATVNIATGASSTSAVNIATGNSTKNITIGGTGTALALNGTLSAGVSTLTSVATNTITGSGTIQVSPTTGINIADNLTTGSIYIGRQDSTATSTTVSIAGGNGQTGAINIGTGNGTKTLTVGGTGTTLALNSLTTTISTSTSSGNGITHSSTTTSGDDMRLTATGGYLIRLGEGSSSAGLTLLGIDSGTSIIKATTSALEIRADAGLTFTGTIGSNNSYTGTNNFQGNVTVQAGNTCRYGSRSVGVPSGFDLGQVNTYESNLRLVTTSDDFYFRTSGNSNMMLFNNSGITAYYPFAMSNNFLINQSAYTSMSSTQLGYTITKTFGPSVLGDTTGTFTLVGSGQALGTNTGVYLITCGFELTNSGSDTVNNKALCLSLSSASGTPVNANGAWEYYEEINDSMGSAGTRYKGTLCGVYIKTTTSAQTLYMNGYANTTGSQTISATGNCSITRIG